MADFESRYVIHPSAEKAEEIAARLAKKPDLKRPGASRFEPRSDYPRADEATTEDRTPTGVSEADNTAGTAYDEQVEQVSERQREATRRRISLFLIGTLVIVVVATFVYVITRTVSGKLSTADFVTLLQGVGATFVTPLIALIGALTGFYYGSLTATHAASQTAARELAPQTQKEERPRETMRGWIAIASIVAVIATVAVLAGIVFAVPSTGDPTRVILLVGTLLTPLIGLVGAIIGFYYGGQTSIQAASQAAHVASQSAQTAQQATQTAAQEATQAATQASPQAQKQPGDG